MSNDNIFKKNVPSSAPMREFTVGAPEQLPGTPVQDYQHLYPNPGVQFAAGQAGAPIQYQAPQMPPGEYRTVAREAREERMAQASKITESAKRRIELLANIGRLTKDVPIGGFVFSIRTLKEKETKDAAMATFSSVATNLEASYEARKQQLARSIFKIDGEDIGLVLGGNDISLKLQFIEDAEEVLINKLWDEFKALKEEAQNKFGINSTKDAEEVAKDLKK